MLNKENSHYQMCAYITLISKQVIHMLEDEKMKKYMQLT